MSKDTRLVYSTDPALNVKCPKCKELQSECTCAPEVDPQGYKFVAVLRIEKQARGGKTVTVVFGLPDNQSFLADLAQHLKRACGTGGTVAEGAVELQGDLRDRVRQALEQRGFTEGNHSEPGHFVIEKAFVER